MQIALLDLSEGSRSRLQAVRTRAARYGRQPPGQFTVLLTVLVVLCLAVSLAAAWDIRHRRAVLDRIINNGGPTTKAALEAYRSLSDADATATGTFLVSGVEPPDLQNRYRDRITKSGVALSMAASGARTDESATTIAELSAYLPVYTGLIETARTYNRQGLPHGATYLREASWLMQDTMLPKAQKLYENEAARLAADQAEAAEPGWLPIALWLLALSGLVAAQIYLARSTRRILNAGLLATTLLAVAAASWYGMAVTAVTEDSTAGRREGTAQVEAFAAARIAALQARSDESLTLVARGNGEPYEDHFTVTADKLEHDGGGLLAQARVVVTSEETGAAVQQATDAWRRWREIHKELRRMDDGGSYDEAVMLATDVARGTVTLSTMVDGQLGLAIQQATDRFENEAARARSSLSGTDVGVAVLMVFAGFGVAAGFTPRLREFRR